MRQHNIITNSKYNGILNSNYNYHNEIVQALQERLDYAIKHHSKVYFVMITVNFPQNMKYPVDNTLFGCWKEKFIKQLDYKVYEPHYIWVREQTSTDLNHHYHICFILNGNKIQSFYYPGLAAQRTWTKTLNIEDAGGLIHYRQQGIMIIRPTVNNNYNFNQTYNSAMQWGSYIAKTKDKFVMQGIRTWDSSNLPKVISINNH